MKVRARLVDVEPGHCFWQIGRKNLDGEQDNTIFLVLRSYEYVNTTTWMLVRQNTFNQSDEVEDLGFIGSVISPC